METERSSPILKRNYYKDPILRELKEDTSPIDQSIINRFNTQLVEEEVLTRMAESCYSKYGFSYETFYNILKYTIFPQPRAMFNGHRVEMAYSDWSEWDELNQKIIKVIVEGLKNGDIKELELTPDTNKDETSVKKDSDSQDIQFHFKDGIEQLINEKSLHHIISVVSYSTGFPMETMDKYLRFKLPDEPDIQDANGRKNWAKLCKIIIAQVCDELIDGELKVIYSDAIYQKYKYFMCLPSSRARRIMNSDLNDSDGLRDNPRIWNNEEEWVRAHPIKAFALNHKELWTSNQDIAESK